MGLVVSTFVIVIIGEIIPQSILTRYGQPIGYALAPVMYFFIILFFFLAFPISLILNLLLGEEEPELYSKTKMKKLFEMYEKDKLLDPSEKRILIATLEISDKKAGTIMKPLD